MAKDFNSRSIHPRPKGRGSLNKLDRMDKILGTPSAQRILRIFACWKSLPFKEVIPRAEFSVSQVNSTLNQLEKAHIIIKEKRGVYTLADTPFVTCLTEAYIQLLVQNIGMELYQLTKSLDKSTPREISSRLNKLIFNWKPLLEQHFSHKLSSLVGHTVDRYREET